MKKGFLLLLLLSVLLMIGLFLASCTTDGETTTRTETKTVTFLPAATGTPSTAETPGVAPLTPHPVDWAFSAGFPLCFNCHPIPPGHEGRMAQEDVCLTCHMQDPAFQ